MTRQEEINSALLEYADTRTYYGNNIAYKERDAAFIAGAEWADEHPKSPWIKFTEKYPPQQEPIIIAVKNKNKEYGIWLYDLCMFFGGDYTDNKNWENKINWEIPIYWMPIPNLPKE